MVSIMLIVCLPVLVRVLNYLPFYLYSQATPQQTPITANGSVPGCTTISSSGIVSGQGTGFGCTSQPQQHNTTSSLSPGSSDSGQQQTQQQLQQLQLSIQNLGLGPSGTAASGAIGGTGNGSNNAPSTSSSTSQQQPAQYARPPISLSAPLITNPLLQKEWEKVMDDYCHYYSTFPPQSIYAY